MKKPSAMPRLAREGFVTAGPERKPAAKFMARPKGCWTGGPSADRLASPGDPVLDQFNFLLDSPERQAMREICELGSFEVVNGKTYLVAPVASLVREVLATFEADREDLTDDGVDLECDDSDLDQDLEPGCDMENAYN